MKIRLVALAALAALAAAALTGCSAPSPAAQSAAPAPAPASETAPVQATTTPPAATTAAQAPAAKTCTVPQVVGMVHQTAQDTMQAAGLFMLREEDATGQGRVLVVDRNWTTTAQSVPAGQEVDCSTEILLSAKKTGE
ncbi:PASTA domain-containing protein [Saccharothrix sp. Mg75]|uniref:PASTA domain-containing protein n=1 Tax=Saccharothrix sp. Mg75 TaxID=3445357 RepID=UPI003EEF6A10